eukprot:s131_g30.t1
MAREIVAMDYRGFDSATAYKICALAATPTDPESTTTFEALASHDQLSKVLVGRLSELIEEAGPKKKQHLKRRERLEQDLSEALGRYFTFHDVTQLTPELHAGDRLQAIRSYLQDFACANLCGAELKVIVVDDFFLSPLSYADPFRITNGELHTLEEVEDFLLQPLSDMGVEASAKVLHCYRKVTTTNGLVLQVGMGLSNGLLKDAKEFQVRSRAPYKTTAVVNSGLDKAAWINPAMPALVEVAEEGAFYNWLLLEAVRMNLHKAGAGGFEELQAHLVDDRVLFGLLRLSFGGAGEGRHGLTKHVLIHWVGPQVGAVRRGLCGAKYGEVSALFGGYCSVAFRHEANQLSDLRLEEIILKLQRLTVVDSVSGDGVAARISLEEYNMARAEELRRQEAQRTVTKTEPKRPKQVPFPGLELVEEPPAKAENGQAAPLPDLKTALRIVRDPKGHINWVLCGLPSRLPPSPCRAFAQMEVRSSRAAG